MMIVLTGGIGSGKSQVCSILSGMYGFHVYEADAKVKELYCTHPTLLADIENCLGVSLRDNDGKFQPTLLAQIIFKDSDALIKVENIVFPALIDDFQKWMSNLEDERPVIFESATVLEKSQFEGFGDMTVLVNAPYSIRLARAGVRDGDSAKVESRMGFQKLMNRLSEGESDPRIDYVIDNSGSIDELKAKIKDFVLELGKNKNVTYIEQ